jgi:predicted aspartyl protease
MTRRKSDRIQGERIYGGLLLTPVRLNDIYLHWFLVDTGAAITLLSERVADEIGIEYANPIRFQRIASLHRTEHIPVIRMSNLQVGTQKTPHLEVGIFPFGRDLKVEGLLGVNFLAQFRVTFEFDKAIMILR